MRTNKHKQILEDRRFVYTDRKISKQIEKVALEIQAATPGLAFAEAKSQAIQVVARRLI